MAVDGYPDLWCIRMPHTAEYTCLKFKKTCRGRPSPTLPCLNCGLVWSVHPWVEPSPKKENPNPHIIVAGCLLSAENFQILEEFLQTSFLEDILFFREREVIKLHYGLADGCFYTLDEIGSIFDLSRERIRQIEAGAFTKLQKLLQLRGKPMSSQDSPELGQTLPDTSSPPITLMPAPESAAKISLPQETVLNKEEPATLSETRENPPVGATVSTLPAKPRLWKKITKLSHEYTDAELLASNLHRALKKSIANATPKDLLKLVRANIDEHWKMVRKAQIQEYVKKIFELVEPSIPEMKITRNGDFRTSSKPTDSPKSAITRRHANWPEKPKIPSGSHIIKHKA